MKYISPITQHSKLMPKVNFFMTDRLEDRQMDEATLMSLHFWESGGQNTSKPMKCVKDYSFFLSLFKFQDH